MASGGGGGQPTLNKTEQAVVAFILLLILVIVIAVVTWHNNHTAIATAIGAVRRAEIAVLSLFTRELDILNTWLATTPPETVTWEQVIYVSSAVGSYTRFLLVPIVVAACVYLYKRDLGLHYSRTLSLRRHIDEKMKEWPHLRVLKGVDMIKQHPLKGAWASPKTEYEFAVANKLLNPDGTLNKPQAGAVFEGLLGKRWTGYKNLAPAPKALLAVMAARIAARATEDSSADKRVMDWVEYLQDEMLKPVPNIEWADALIQAAMRDTTVKRIFSQHYYEHGVFLSLLSEGRKTGVFLPSGHILWLRPLDQQLFLTLNALPVEFSRGVTVWAEAAGTFSHWLAELKHNVGRDEPSPLEEPYIESAVDGFEEALSWFTMDDKKAAIVAKNLAGG